MLNNKTFENKSVSCTELNCTILIVSWRILSIMVYLFNDFILENIQIFFRQEIPVYIISYYSSNSRSIEYVEP